MKQTLNRESGTRAAIRAGSRILAAPVRVSEVMTRKTISLRPNQSFADVVAVMANRSFHHVLVVDADDHLRGVISDRDVLRALSRTSNWNKESVTEIMSRELVTTTPHSLISAAARQMLAKRINCLPVIDDGGRVCGILTSTDLIKAYVAVQALVEKYH